MVDVEELPFGLDCGEWGIGDRLHQGVSPRWRDQSAGLGSAAIDGVSKMPVRSLSVSFQLQKSQLKTTGCRGGCVGDGSKGGFPVVDGRKKDRKMGMGVTEMIGVERGAWKYLSTVLPRAASAVTTIGAT